MHCVGTGILGACLGAFLIGLGGCSDGPDPRDPPSSPIVFANLGATGWEIVRIDPAGTRRTVLTTNADDDLFPSLSPDGQSIAYYAGLLYQMTIDGTSHAPIGAVGLPGSGMRRVAWSPDMTRIASQEQTGVIISRRLDTEAPQTIATGFGPSWSPDGQRILFIDVSPDLSGSAVYSATATGTDRQLVVDGATDPAWSPDGREIVYARMTNGGGIFVADASGQNERRITTKGLHSGLLDESPVWSPNGRWIAFQRSYEICGAGPFVGEFCELQWDIFIVRADGTGLRNVTNAVGQSVRPTW
jgi:TolB protein